MYGAHYNFRCRLHLLSRVTSLRFSERPGYLHVLDLRGNMYRGTVSGAFHIRCQFEKGMKTNSLRVLAQATVVAFAPPAHSLQRFSFLIPSGGGLGLLRNRDEYERSTA